VFPFVPGGGLQPVAATPAAGFPMQNATPTVLSWAVPNDGNLHEFIICSCKVVTSAETGGLVQVSFTDPGGTVRNLTIYPGTQGAGFQATTGAPSSLMCCQAGTTVSVNQVSALSAGASTLWCKLLGS